MKKIFALALAAVYLTACSDNKTADTTHETTGTGTHETGTTGTGTSGTTETGTATTPSTTTTTTTTSTNEAYSPVDGDVTYRNNKVMRRTNGEWVEAKEDVNLDNDVVVYRDGRVTRNGRKITLKEGEVVNKTGDFFDKSGRAIENAWDDTKAGAKEMAKDVGNAAEKAGKKIKNVVDNDKE